MQKTPQFKLDGGLRRNCRFLKCVRTGVRTRSRQAETRSELGQSTGRIPGQERKGKADLRLDVHAEVNTSKQWRHGSRRLEKGLRKDLAKSE